MELDIAIKKLEELKINHAETARDREFDYPSIDEEEEMSSLEQAIEQAIAKQGG